MKELEPGEALELGTSMEFCAVVFFFFQAKDVNKKVKHHESHHMFFPLKHVGKLLTACAMHLLLRTWLAQRLLTARP